MKEDERKPESLGKFNTNRSADDVYIIQQKSKFTSESEIKMFPKISKLTSLSN